MNQLNTRFMRGVLAVTAVMTVASSGAVGAENGGRYVEGEILIKLKADRSTNRQAALASTLAAVDATDAGALLELPAVHKILLKDGADTGKALEKLNSLSEVEYAEPNYIYTIDALAEDLPRALPSEKKMKKQWGLYNKGGRLSLGGGLFEGVKGADIKAGEAWAIDPAVKDAAENVVVAVIDTGISLTHKDLKSNLWRNPGETGAWEPPAGAEVDKKLRGCHDKSCNGIDDDGNGYVDDYQGWNWVPKSKLGLPVVGNRPMDDNMHGTHVAGIIGASHNGKGVAGVNSKVKLMPLKFLSKSGSGTLEGGVEAIGYAVKMKADVINASWGGPGDSKALGEAVARAVAQGVTVVVAAGNSAENNDWLVRTPANYPGVISVIASDMRDEMAFFSSFGRAKTHLAAPGFEILSTLRKHFTVPILPVPVGFRYNSYGFLSGTSMAAPFVSGAAAMLIGLQPAQFKGKPAALKQRLMDTSDIRAPLIARTSSGGRLNLYNAIQGIVPAGHLQPSTDTWSATQQFFAESEHPYKNGASSEHLIRHAGAKWIRVHFGNYSLEPGVDQLEVYGADGTLYDVITGFDTHGLSRAVQGDSVKLVFKTDKNVNGWGYEITGYDFQ